MPKHTVTASKTFRVLLQSTPFIYPPTPFSFKHRQHMILVEKYFPTNYFACQKNSTPPPPNKKFPKKQDISALGFFQVGSPPPKPIGLIGGHSLYQACKGPERPQRYFARSIQRYKWLSSLNTCNSAPPRRARDIWMLPLDSARKGGVGNVLDIVSSNNLQKIENKWWPPPNIFRQIIFWCGRGGGSVTLELTYAHILVNLFKIWAG
jgi:hypothetical protein